MDKGLKGELEQLGLHPATTPFMLPQDESRDIGLVCQECGSKKVVYFIVKPLGQWFRAGAYCYKHLLQECRQAHCLPYPIESNLLNQLKQDLGIPLYEEPKNILEI